MLQVPHIHTVLQHVNVLTQKDASVTVYDVPDVRFLAPEEFSMSNQMQQGAGEDAPPAPGLQCVITGYVDPDTLGRWMGYREEQPKWLTRVPIALRRVVIPPRTVTYAWIGDDSSATTPLRPDDKPTHMLWVTEAGMGMAALTWCQTRMYHDWTARFARDRLRLHL
jgi:hypothetical protein